MITCCNFTCYHVLVGFVFAVGSNLAFSVWR